jgi:hypothetical protein
MITRRGIAHSICLVALIATALSLGLACAAATEETSEKAGPPRVEAVVVETPPVLDGVLDDACWEQATHIEGFWRQTTDAPEYERTEAWICCDDSAIYVAFRCHDTEPEEIRCDQKKRQGSLWRDDVVEFWLDVTDDGQSFYSFWVNAAGTQWDRVPGGTNEKIEWKGDWRAAAQTDEAGWSAEMAIPFHILRYPQGQTTFRFDVCRRLAREEDRSLWPAEFARTFDFDECAKLTGVPTPPVPFRYVLMPYALSVASEGEEERELLTAGLDFKGTFPNGVVSLATVNPDFRNLEDVVETIDFTFVERYLPEYRPFFQEGSGYFPSSPTFYSRRIEDFDLGAKAFGKLGSHSFALLDTYGRGGENHLVWEYAHHFGTRGTTWFSRVDRRVPDDPRNTADTLAANWEWPFVGGGRSVFGGVSRSHTEGEGGDDTTVSFSAGEQRNQGLSYSASYSAVGDDFRADDGYVPETGVRRFAVDLFEHRSFDEGATQARDWWFSVDTGESQEGRRGGFWLGHDYYWRSGWVMWAGTSHGERDGFDVKDVYIGGRWNRKDMYRSGKIDFMWGERYGEPYRYNRLIQAFRPGERWAAELRAEQVYAADLDDEGNVIPPEWSRQLVLTTTYDISEERSASGRLVRTEGGTNAYAAYRQRVRRGMDLLVVVGDPNAEEWVSRLAIKAIWCL